MVTLRSDGSVLFLTCDVPLGLSLPVSLERSTVDVWRNDMVMSSGELYREWSAGYALYHAYFNGEVGLTTP